MKVLRGPSASEHHRTSVPAPAKVSALSHMGFSHRRSVLRPLFRMLHGLLGYQGFDLSVYHLCPSLFCRSDWLANLIACASFSPPVSQNRYSRALRPFLESVLVLLSTFPGAEGRVSEDKPSMPFPQLSSPYKAH
jgi:hypothetical protein